MNARELAQALNGIEYPVMLRELAWQSPAAQQKKEPVAA